MSGQVDVEISSIFDDVIRNNLKHCYVCLRTEKERKLVDPVNFKKCLKAWGITIPAFPAYTICNMCEAECSRAMALFQAIDFATIVNRWLRHMSTQMKRGCNWKKWEVTAYVSRQLKIKNRHAGGACPEAGSWRRMRARSELVQTEVLVIEPATSEQPTEPFPRQQQSHAPGRPPPAQPATRNGAADSDSIVIILDDEDPLDISSPPPLKRAPKPSNPIPIACQKVPPPIQIPVSYHSYQIVQNTATIVQNLPTLVLNTPIIVPNAPSVVPLNNQQNTNTNVVSKPIPRACQMSQLTPKIVPLKQLQNNKTTVVSMCPDNSVILAQTVDADNKYIVQQLVLGSDGNYRVTNTPITDLTPPENENKDPEMDTSDQINISGVRTLGNSENDNVKPQAHAEKRPVMSGRIDWEDKIPMDVISFVDASDPMIQQNDPKRPRYQGDVIDLP